MSPIRNEIAISGEAFMPGLHSIKLVLASGSAFAALSCAMSGSALAQSVPEQGAAQPANTPDAVRPGGAAANPHAGHGKP